MTFVKMQQQYPTLTGLAKDVQTNTLHFRSANPDIGAVTAEIWTHWENFLTNIDGLMDNGIFATTWPCDFYDMEDPEPRIPVLEEVFTATLDAVNQSLPLECTMVVSYAAAPESGAIAARRRGRIFLPTFVDPSTNSASGQVSWDNTTINAVGGAFQAFVDNVAAEATPILLSVFSPTNYALTSSYDLSTIKVESLWVDNEPDTQRRRGEGAGVKTNFPIVIP